MFADLGGATFTAPQAALRVGAVHGLLFGVLARRTRF
jgi:hypothetical protein